MVTVEYDADRYAFQAQGHAGSGDPGRDLVCAGVSALVLTLRENLKDLERGGQLRMQDARTELGFARFRCAPIAGAEERLRTLYETVLTGLRLLENLFGEYVQVKEGPLTENVA